MAEEIETCKYFGRGQEESDETKVTSCACKKKVGKKEAQVYTHKKVAL